MQKIIELDKREAAEMLTLLDTQRVLRKLLDGAHRAGNDLLDSWGKRYQIKEKLEEYSFDTRTGRLVHNSHVPQAERQTKATKRPKAKTKGGSNASNHA